MSMRKQLTSFKGYVIMMSMWPGIYFEWLTLQGKLTFLPPPPPRLFLYIFASAMHRCQALQWWACSGHALTAEMTTHVPGSGESCSPQLQKSLDLFSASSFFNPKLISLLFKAELGIELLVCCLSHNATFPFGKQLSSPSILTFYSCPLATWMQHTHFIPIASSALSVLFIASFLTSLLTTALLLLFLLL